MEQAICQAFTPEFLGRLDGSVRFEPLSQETMGRIAEKYLRALQERAAGAGIQLSLPQELASALCARCRGRDGARQLRRLVQTEVEGALSGFLLGCSRRPARVRGSLNEGVLSFQA